MSWESVSEEEMKNNDSEAEFWNPEKGDTLQGTVQAVAKGKFKKLFLVLEDDEGKEWITTQCASLDKQIKKLGIEEDDIVHLTYNGRLDDEYHSHDYKLLKWVE